MPVVDVAPKFPKPISKIGGSIVQWQEVTPETAMIRATGGTYADQRFAERLIEIRLASFGIKRHLIGTEKSSFTKFATWHDDVQPKAKRLLQEGKVTVKSNEWEVTTGRVIGDTGEYDVMFERKDPSSRKLSMWKCECAWNQFAWGRTRQWKKYEGRPCSHVLALYWKSLSTPLDRIPEDKMHDPGQFQGPSTPSTPGGAPPLPAGTQTTFDPNEPDPSAPVPALTPEESMFMGREPEAPPGSPLPMSPAEQYAAMQPAAPGTSPAGMPAPASQSVSVPGARQQTPANPIQNPGNPGVGGTYSKVITSEFKAFEEGSIVRAVNEVFGIAEGKSEEHGAGQYKEIPAGATGEVLSQDPTLGWVEVIFPLDGGELTPYHVRVFCEPDDLKTTRLRSPGPFIKRR